MTKKKRITIHDLAAELKVSASTISRALNGHYSISKNTREKIVQFAQKRGYRPNKNAVNLRKQVTRTIGVIVPRINRPFISSLLNSIETEAQKLGFNIIISQSDDSYAKEQSIVTNMIDLHVSGVIVSLAMETRNYSHFEEFHRTATPLVFVDRVPLTSNFYKVEIDNFQSGYIATEHLISQGCKRVAIISGAQNQKIYIERLRGYHAALKDYNLENNPDLEVFGNGLSYVEGSLLTTKLLDSTDRPDGIFSTNDTSAIAAIQVAKSLNIQVPKDLAIVGFNDDPECTYIEPPLTTIYQPAIELGKLSVSKIDSLIKGDGDHTSRLISLTTNLVVRKSTRPKPMD